MYRLILLSSLLHRQAETTLRCSYSIYSMAFYWTVKQSQHYSSDRPAALAQRARTSAQPRCSEKNICCASNRSAAAGACAWDPFSTSSSDCIKCSSRWAPGAGCTSKKPPSRARCTSRPVQVSSFRVFFRCSGEALASSLPKKDA